MDIKAATSESKKQSEFISLLSRLDYQISRTEKVSNDIDLKVRKLKSKEDLSIEKGEIVQADDGTITTSISFLITRLSKLNDYLEDSNYHLGNLVD